jgi:hypothetical protein
MTLSAVLAVLSSQSLMDKIDDLGKVIKNLEDLTAPRTLADVESGKAAPNLPSAIARLDYTLAQFGSDENAAHLRDLLKNLAESSTKLDKTLDAAQDVFSTTNSTLAKVGPDLAAGRAPIDPEPPATEPPSAIGDESQEPRPPEPPAEDRDDARDDGSRNAREGGRGGRVVRMGKCHYPFQKILYFWERFGDFN